MDLRRGLNRWLHDRVSDVTISQMRGDSRDGTVGKARDEAAEVLHSDKIAASRGKMTRL